MDLCDNPLDSVIPFPFHIWQEITFTPKKCRYIQFFLSKAVNEKTRFLNKGAFINHVDMAGEGVCQMSILQHKPYKVK